MSELSVQIEALKEKSGKTTNEIVAGIGISRQSFRRLERGESVKLSTLKQIADYLGATPDQWTELVAAWLKLEAGPESEKLRIEPRDRADVLHDAETEHGRLIRLYERLTAEERQQILLAFERPEVRAAIPALNRLYDALRQGSRVESAARDIVDKATSAHKTRSSQ